MAVYPITTAAPSYMVRVAGQRINNIWYDDEPVVLEFWVYGSGQTSRNLQAFTGNYYVRNYDGDLVRDGALSSATSVTFTGLPYGWYRIYLTQSNVHATYGTAGGAGMFTIVKSSAHFPSLAATTGPFIYQGGTGSQQVAPRIRGISALGLMRYATQNPTIFATELADTKACLAEDLNWYLNPAYQDPVRPHRQLFLFAGAFMDSPEGQACITQAVTELTAQFGTDVIAFEGPSNEPVNTAPVVAPKMQAFYNLVKDANPDAMVIGGAQVDINVGHAQWWHDFLELCAAMDPVPFDAISHHNYNSGNGDLSLHRRAIETWMNTIASFGLDNKPVWQTEQGWRCSNFGVMTPHWSCYHNLLHSLVYEQYGVTKEQNNVWYDSSHGFWLFPNFFQYGDGNMGPTVGMYRTLSDELWGKTLAETYRFGTPGDDMLVASRYQDDDGHGVATFIAAGSTDLTVDVGVRHAWHTMTVIDKYGNRSTIARDSDGHISLPVGRDPVYLRLPIGTTIQMGSNWPAVGPELSKYTRLKEYTTSGSDANVTGNLRHAVDGKQQSSYYFNSEALRGYAESPYIDDTNSHPSWLELTWKAAKSINGVIVFCAPPYQQGGALLDFDVQTWNGSSWVTQGTRTEKADFGLVSDPDANIFKHVCKNEQGACSVESFYRDRWIFDVPFASTVSTTKLRIYVRDATYGQWPTIECVNATIDAHGYGNNFTIREVYAYNTGLATRRFVVET